MRSLQSALDCKNYGVKAVLTTGTVADGTGNVVTTLLLYLCMTMREL